MLRCLFALLCIRTASCGKPLEGKVAFITGASSGIGMVVAKHLASKGMKVVLTARRVDKLEENVKQIEQAGGSAVAVACDVADGATVEAAFAAAEKTYGGVDFVFANAGIEGNVLKSAHHETDDIVFQSLANINIVGAWLTLKHAAIAFEKRGGGTIAFSSSVGAFCGDVCNSVVTPPGSGLAYMSTKATTDMIAEIAHGSYGSKGVNVYNFNIAQFASEMGDRLGFKPDVLNPFNPIFKHSLGDPVHIGEVIVAILDGTSLWPPGSAIVIDNDATVHAKYFMDKRKEPGDAATMGWRSPEELKKVAMDVKGAPYKWKDEL